MIITVVGQGYVGLPLAIAASKAQYKVYGLDTNNEKIKLLKIGRSNIEGISDSEILANVVNGNYIPTTNPEFINKSNTILICVPTPLTGERRPDLSALKDATTTVGKYLRAGSLVIVESTIEPGTCRNILYPILTKESGLGLDEFQLAYSPERIDPANSAWGIKNTPKLLAGISNSATQNARLFYEKFVDRIIECQSIEIAETAKLLENTFRLVNISFINELSIFCQKTGIDVIEVIAAAATKPYGFMPFYPSIGVGGHCIPIDPIYLAEAAKAVGAPTQFVDLATEINQNIPQYFVNLAEEKLNGLKGKRILIIGVAYKPNVADVRETPVHSLIFGLQHNGAEVSWHDDLVKEWNGEKSVPLSSNYDLAVLATPHDYLDLKSLGNVPILNTRNPV